MQKTKYKLRPHGAIHVLDICLHWYCHLCFIYILRVYVNSPWFDSDIYRTEKKILKRKIWHNYAQSVNLRYIFYCICIIIMYEVSDHFYIDFVKSFTISIMLNLISIQVAVQGLTVYPYKHLTILSGNIICNVFNIW